MPNKSPVLAIDARLYGNRSWAWRIATATVDRFAKDYPDSYSKIVLFAHSRKVFNALPEGRNVKKVLINCHFLFGKLFLVPFWLLAHRADVYFSPTSELPVWKPFGTKYVNMVHDLFMEDILDESTGKGRGLLKAFRHFMKTLNAFESYYLADFFKSSFFRSDLILAISTFSLRQAAERYALPIERFKVLPIWADELFFEDFDKDSALVSVREKFWIPWKFVFSYDAIADYAKLADSVAEQCSSNGLTWVILNRHPSIYEIFQKSPHKNKAVFIREFVSDDDLVNLIRASEFVFFPSIWEGFWIPIAESLAAWKLVIVPNITAMPEVGWDFAICYDPNSPADLSEKFGLALDTYGQCANQSKSAFVQRYRWWNFTNSLWSIFADVLSD